MVETNIFRQNPMEEWVKQKVGDTGEGRLSREKLEQVQLDRINETIRHGIENSPYYRETLKNWEKGRLFSLSQLQELPFLDEKILRDRGEDLSCIPAREIKRIVTLQTSGSTGAPKRIWFTEEDQELTTDFFHHGMQNIINRQDRAVVFTLVLAVVCTAAPVAAFTQGQAEACTQALAVGSIPVLVVACTQGLAIPIRAIFRPGKSSLDTSRRTATSPRLYQFARTYGSVMPNFSIHATAYGGA